MLREMLLSPLPPKEEAKSKEGTSFPNLISAFDYV